MGFRFVKRPLESATIGTSTVISGYVDLIFSLLRTNIWKKSFSSAGYAVTDLKKMKLTKQNQYELFPSLNSSFWEVQDVSDIVH